ncbi:MAG: hypothetical protein LBC77_02855 [Spirochaetaceae bacterium]|jgi:hypothetical protein|nr:hypothetical protein [Spirochaetaceae bacterium]
MRTDTVVSGLHRIMAEKLIEKAQELFYHLIGKVFEEKINSFGDLCRYLNEVAPNTLQDARYRKMIFKVFVIIKRLNWGFFVQLDKKQHERLWREIVVEDKRWPETGDLKKTITVSNLYIAMLDIHGYTKFCNENKSRLDKLHLFDRTIGNQIQHIASQCQSICRRERGDEMLVISAQATDCVCAAISIIDFFAGTKTLPASKIDTGRTGDSKALPNFKISAGIAGGQTPLIITETGNLSGPLLNTAARLQMRANELSPKESKIMATKQVMLLVESESKKQGNDILVRGSALQFYDTGHIEFKGVLLPCCEIIFKDSEKYKTGFFNEIIKLEDSVRQGAWENTIFLNLVNLIIKAASTMPAFTQNICSEDGETAEIIKNETIERKCIIAINQFLHKQNFSKAVDTLDDIVKKIEVIPEFDRLTLDYALSILKRYQMVLPYYSEHIEKLVDERACDILNEKDLMIFSTLRKNIGVYEKLRQNVRESPKLKQRKAYWSLAIKTHKEKMDLQIYSGKK